MHQSLLAQYISGKKKPSSRQVERIMDGIEEVARELLRLRIAWGKIFSLIFHKDYFATVINLSVTTNFLTFLYAELIVNEISPDF